MLTISTWEECDGLEGTLCKFMTLALCGSLERTDFQQFLLGKSVMVLKELFVSLYFGSVWWS